MLICGGIHHGEFSAGLRLGDFPMVYVFSIDKRQDPPILHIPGEQRGPDVYIPVKPEQEDWLNGLDDLLAPFWYCQWKFHDRESCEYFVEYVKDLEEEP